MVNKQTAVEWLTRELGLLLNLYDGITLIFKIDVLVKQAKEMEKEQRRNDFFAGVKCTCERYNGEYPGDDDEIKRLFAKSCDEWIELTKQQ